MMNYLVILFYYQYLGVTILVLIKNNYYTPVERPKKYITQFALSTFSEVNQLYTFMTSDTFFDNFKILFNNITDWFLKIRIYPFDVKKLFNINLPSFQITINNIETGVNGKYCKLNKAYINLGEYSFNKKFNSFLDYSPYTKISIYLPYLGTYDLPVNEIMGHTINIRYIIDSFTGDLTCNIVKIIESTESIILSVTGSIGYDLPLGQTNANELSKKLLTFIPDMIGSFTKGGSNVVDKITSIPQQFTQEHYIKGSLTSGFTGFVNNQNVQLIIERPIIAKDTNYDKNFGKPLYESRVLSDLRGYTMVEEIHLENIPTATDGELKEIDSLLRNGVII